MKVTVSVNFNKKQALEVRGLGSSKKAQKQLASDVKSLAAPYVPMQQGILANTAVIANDGSQLVYPGPYAHYQWEGIVRGPNYTDGEKFWSGKAPKAPTGKELTYSGAPMRGKKWIPRMLADRRKDLEARMEAFIAKKGGKG